MERLQVLNSQICNANQLNEEPKYTGKFIKASRAGNILLLRMDSGKKVTALSIPLMKELDVTLERVEGDSSITCIILTGSGKTFAAGADISEFKDATMKKQIFEDYFSRVWLRMLGSIRKPVIAACNGLAFGGGFETLL